ncbi:hypothetical protein [Argonema antarcticum]|uniref:hypothetical protein n=1 Tax=Argonema antarcticum TaxID=2942763 RepID=UPI0020115706|nr:hypothetical protein [Argonema antarcticum]MCL1472665.1 hypothetical protein [Argonema antarcticum A004/B2]
MTQTPEQQRLDRIERILDNMATNLINERDARLAQREDLEEFYQTVRRWAESTDSAINRLVENAEADRAAIREMQAEVTQVWQYLLSQRPNGSSGGS